MSTTGAQALATQGNVLPMSLAFDAPPAPETVTSPAEQDYVAFEMANATILAAALGMGVYVDTFV